MRAKVGVFLVAGFAAGLLASPMAGCVASEELTLMQPGPAQGADGAFRELQSAVTGNYLFWTTQLLAAELVPEGATDQFAREAIARSLIGRLRPIMRESLIVTDAPDVTYFYDAAGQLETVRATLTAHVTPIVKWDGGRALAEYAQHAPPDAAPTAPPTTIIRTEWVSEASQWRLSGLRLETPASVWRLMPNDG